MSLVRYLPMLPDSRDIDTMLENFNWPALQGAIPAVDVYQTKDDVVVETPLPGVDANKVNISIENDVLTIESEMEKKNEVDERNYYRKEVRYSSFHRSVSLPTSVNGDKAKATYDKGVLKIIIPKEERAKPKTVKVEVK